MSACEDIVHLLTPYLMAFPNCKINAGGLVVYSKVLSKLELVEIEAAMNKIILTSKFFPSVAEIYEQVQVMRNYALTKSGLANNLTDAEAWENVQKVVKGHGQYSREPWIFANEKVERAARQYGLMELCRLESNEVGIARAQFMKIYNRIVSKENADRYNNIALNSLGGSGVKKLIGNIAEVKKIGE